MLIAIEGIDGAGKGTLAGGLVEHLLSAGHPARLVSFPRYKETPAGRLIGSLLGAADSGIGEMSVEFLAALFAEDRRQSAPVLNPKVPGEIVVCDRFTASNAAFQCGRLPKDRHADFIRWLEDLEHGRFGTPRPDLNIWLDIPPALSRAFVAMKARRSYTEETHDANEADATLQERAAAAYGLMAAADTEGRWVRIQVAPEGSPRPLDEIRAEVIAQVAARLKG